MNVITQNPINTMKSGNTPTNSAKVFHAFWPKPKIDKTNDGKFSLDVALSNFGSNFFSIIRELLKRPLHSIGIAVGFSALTCFFPQFGRISILVGTFQGLKSLVSGAVDFGKALKTKDGDYAEKAFGKIGNGSSTVLISGIFARGMVKVKGADYLKSNKTNFGGKTIDWFKSTTKAVKEEVLGSYINILKFGKINFKAFKQAKTPGDFLKIRESLLKDIHSKSILTPRQISDDMGDLTFSDKSIKEILNIKEIIKSSWTYLPEMATKKVSAKIAAQNIIAKGQSTHFMEKSLVMQGQNKTDARQNITDAYSLYKNYVKS